ncbi:hypothetical protein BC828DRAFT_376980 [Blastocladiella britannica]|nr:hypothetical protein BC828DRAFT_376980 [Blastocladiella britannica]
MATPHTFRAPALPLSQQQTLSQQSLLSSQQSQSSPYQPQQNQHLVQQVQQQQRPPLAHATDSPRNPFLSRTSVVVAAVGGPDPKHHPRMSLAARFAPDPTPRRQSAHAQLLLGSTARRSTLFQASARKTLGTPSFLAPRFSAVHQQQQPLGARSSLGPAATAPRRATMVPGAASALSFSSTLMHHRATLGGADGDVDGEKGTAAEANDAPVLTALPAATAAAAAALMRSMAEMAAAMETARAAAKRTLGEAGARAAREIDVHQRAHEAADRALAMLADAARARADRAATWSAARQTSATELRAQAEAVAAVRARRDAASARVASLRAQTAAARAQLAARRTARAVVVRAAAAECMQYEMVLGLSVRPRPGAVPVDGAEFAFHLPSEHRARVALRLAADDDTSSGQRRNTRSSSVSTIAPQRTRWTCATCEPPVPGIDALVAKLDREGDVPAFLRAVRRAWIEVLGGGNGGPSSSRQTPLMAAE